MASTGESYSESKNENPDANKWDILRDDIDKANAAPEIELTDDEKEIIESFPGAISKFFQAANQDEADEMLSFFDDDQKLEAFAKISQDPEYTARLQDEFFSSYEQAQNEELDEEDRNIVRDRFMLDLLERAIKSEQDDDKIHEHLGRTCDFLQALGAQLPIKHLAPFARMQMYELEPGLRGKFDKLGLISDELKTDLYLRTLNSFEEESNVPAGLLTLDARDYWWSESDKAGSSILHDILMHISEENRSKAFDENGRPTALAFSPESDFMKSDIFESGEYMSYDKPSQKARAKGKLQFVLNNIDKIEDPVYKLLTQASVDVNWDDADEIKRFQTSTNKLSGSRLYGAEHLLDENRRPTTTFWEEMYLSGVPALSKACIENSGIKFSDEQKSLLNLDPQVQDDIAIYARDKDKKKPLDVIDSILDADGKLKEHFFTQSAIGKTKFDNILKHFPDQAQQHFGEKGFLYLRMPEDYRRAFVDCFDARQNLTTQPDITEAITEYFDGQGAKPELFQELFNKGKYRLLSEGPIPLKDIPLKKIQKHFLEQLFPKDLSVLEKMDIENDLKDTFSRIDWDKLSTEENVGHVIQLTNRIRNSNAIELQRSSGNFLTAIVQSDNYEEKFNQIEQVFLHNNLPYAGKVFKTFQVLHPAEGNFGDKLSQVSERGILGKLPNQGPRSKEAVLFTDLMKASIDSNSRSMRAWIQQMRDSNEKYLKTAYLQTQAGKANPDGAFESTERYSEADRAVRSFGYLLGLKSLDDLEHRMDEKVTEADRKGRERFARNDFRIEAGDLVKAIQEEHIGDMLQNGIVCKDFLNGEVATDTTPLDADLNVIPDGLDDSVSAVLEWKNGGPANGVAFNAMRVNLVMKRDERFVPESEEIKYDAEKFALWQNDDINYGIRVGFPSSAIDFITFDTENSRADDKTFLFQEIAKNGFYIPVVDQKSGECIFSPDNFDELRKKLSGLEVYGGGNYQFASDEQLADVEIAEIAKDMLNDTNAITEKRSVINTALGDILKTRYADFRGLKDSADGDLTPGYFELIDTGSTGRGTSIPGSKADFDFILRVDSAIYNDYLSKDELETAIKKGLRVGQDKSTGNGLRLKDVEIPGLNEPVDIDISLVQRTNRMEFSTDQAVRERLAKMIEQDPVRAQLAMANIVKAKQFLKSIDAYKPQHSSETDDATKKGGLGGVGVENWILQNGGSFKAAARSFLAAADRANGDFEKFKGEYPIWDAGQNHFTVRDNEGSVKRTSAINTYLIPYDNFITRNMSESGFKRMTEGLRKYLAETTS